MVEKLTLTKKRNKILLAVKIIEHSIDNKISIAKASKKYKKDRRFIYDVNRRWIKKNNVGIEPELIADFKYLYKIKDNK